MGCWWQTCKCGNDVLSSGCVNTFGERQRNLSFHSFAMAKYPTQVVCCGHLFAWHCAVLSSGWLSGNNYSASRQVDLVMKAGYLFIWNKELHHNSKENDRLVLLQRSQKRRGRREVGGDTVRVWGRWWARSTRGSSCRDTGTSPSPSATGREAPPRISGTTVLMFDIMRVRKSWVGAFTTIISLAMINNK